MPKSNVMEFRFEDCAIPVNMATRAALLDEVDRRLRAAEGFAIATINMDHLVKLKHSAAFRVAYAAQDLIVADGNPILWLARIGGYRLELLPGSDLVLPFAEHAVAAGRSIALLGSSEEALAGAEAALKAAVPGLRIVCRIAPPMGYDPGGDLAAAHLSEIAASGAGLCFVALGAPRQEMLAARGRMLAPGVGFASIGAGLDFLSGDQIRAPLWVQRIKMEWAWRLASQPGRLARRYAMCFAILPGQALAALRLRHETGQGGKC